MEKKLYISPLPENSGPGDLLGAITGESGVDGSDVGEINIQGSIGTVFVSDEVAEKVARDVENVSGVSVSIASADDDYKSHFMELERLVEIEREEEMKRHEREIRNTSGYEREEKGRAILHLRGRDEGTGLGGKHLIKFMRQKQGEQLPETEIAVGDLVMISKNDPLRDDNPTGTVAEKTNYSITVAFDKKPPGFLYGKGLRCDLYVNDITYQRQLEALVEICDASDSRLKELGDKALGRKDIEFDDCGYGLESLNSDLNESQRRAIENALSS